jgi:hypothetical protein
MPLVDENDFDTFLDVAVRDESDTDAFRRSRGAGFRRPSVAASVRSDDGSSSCFSVASFASPSDPEPRLSSRRTSPCKTVNFATSHNNNKKSNNDHQVPSFECYDLDAGSSNTSSATAAVTDSSTVISDTQDEQSVPCSAHTERVVELENEVARLKFEAADFRAQSDYYRLQHRQLRVQFEDLQAFCQQLQQENDELRSMHQIDSNKRGGIWPFHKEEPTKLLGPPLQPPESLSHVNFEPYSAPEQAHKEKLKAAKKEIQTSNSATEMLKTTRAEPAMVADAVSISSGCSEVTPKAGNVYAELSLENTQSDTSPYSTRSTSTPPVNAPSALITGEDQSGSSWWPFSGQNKRGSLEHMNLEVDEDIDLKDFRAPRPRDPKIRMEELKKRSALSSDDDELGRHSGHLRHIGMSMTS